MKPKHILFFTALLFASFVSDAQTVLWATATEGGANNQGTILQADSTGTNFHAVYSFYNPTGATPAGKMVLANNGKIYGVAEQGGFGDSCVLYTYAPGTGTYTDIHEFSAYPQQGDDPYSGLIIGSNGIIYGLTASAGAFGGGVIYSVDPSNDSYQAIYHFNDSTGSNGSGELLESNGVLYGMTNYGGSTTLGVIFSFNPATNLYTELYNFNGATGRSPLYGGLIINNGKLYGMTRYGGASNMGVIFSFDLSTNVYTDLHDFDGIHGSEPYGSLIEASNGILYGLTYSGGASGFYGVLFSYQINTSSFTDLFDLQFNSGGGPQRSLTQASNGKLYGTTYQGGTNGFGVIFNYDIITNTYTKLFDFNGINGKNPTCDILETPAIPTALPSLSSNQTFSIYPNPAINSITINGSHSPVEIVDVYGRVIKTLVTDGRAITTVDVSGFPDVFFVRDGEGMVRKVVRRR